MVEVLLYRDGRYDSVVKTEKAVNVRLPEAIDRARRTVSDLGWTLLNSDTSTGVLKARTGAGLTSWGEEINVSLKADGASTLVTVESHPIAQMFDWGKSQRNVSQFLERFEGG